MLTIYKASAGSGKTYTLTLEYIKLLLGLKDKDSGIYYLNNSEYLKRVNHNVPVESNRHRHILAITFTNKATEEMKTRIIKELVAITKSTATDKKTSYVDDLLKIFPGSDVNMLNKTAKIALTDLLVDFDNFNVSTIDSFFQQVLRSLAYELDYPGNYEVVINTDPVTTQAVDMMLDDLNFNPDQKSSQQLKNVLKTYMREQYQQGKGFNIFNRQSSIHDTIINSVNTLFNEKYQLISDDFNKWRQANPDAIKDFGLQLKAWQQELLDKNAADFQRITNSINTNFSDGDLDKNFLKLIDRFNGTPQAFATYAKGKNAKGTLDKLRAGSTKKLNSKADNERNRAIVDAIGDLLIDMLKRFARYADAQTLYSEISTYSFMRYTSTFIEQIRADNNIVVLADTNELLHHVMKDNSELPFVYEKMGVNLTNFLIDEFQDTSKLQWQNLRELVFTGISNGDDSLIIGDEKQAIYRFRNSDSTMLHSSVANEVTARRQELNPRFSDTNWRSAAEVVKFNNTFFARWAKFHNVDGYQTAPQLIAPKNIDLKGYVHFYNIPKEGIPDPLAIKPDDADDDYQQPTINQFEVMVREIRRQLANGYQYRDIAVLVDTKSHGSQVVDTLLKEKFPIITDESLMLNNCQSIRSIISIMQLTVNAKDRKIANRFLSDNELNQVHKYKSFSADQAGKFEFEFIKNKQLGMSDNEAAAKAIDTTFDDANINVIDDVAEIAAANPSTIYTLVEHIIQKRIPEAQRMRDLAYIAAFQDTVMDYARNYGNNTVAFLKWWESAKQKLTINSPDDVDAIKIMTIHKSKGLEFDCVHIPFGSWILTGNPNKRESIWVDKQELIDNFDLPDYLVNAMPPYARITLNGTTADTDSIFKKYYDENMTSRMVDGFNKTYVAYTRAKRELCVYYGEYENRKLGIATDIMNIGNIPDYKAEIDNTSQYEKGEYPAFNPDINLNLQDYISESGEIIIGEPTSPIEKSKKSVDNIKHHDYWLSPADLVDRYDANFDGPGKCITSVQALYDEEAGDLDDDPVINAHDQMLDAAAERGDRLHFILSRIDKISDINRALATARRFLHLGKDFDSIAADTHRFFNTPSTAQYVKRWFSDQRRAVNEMTIYDPDAPVTEQKVQRPDRIVWNKDGSIDIVDYKFAAKNAEHQTQVRRYMNLVKRIYPNANINGFIWYADGDNNHQPHVDHVTF